MNVVSRQNQKL